MNNFSKKEIEDGVVQGANHGDEFTYFYDSHRRLCDIISGLRYFVKFNPNNPELPEKFLINRFNFQIAINLVSAFKLRYTSNNQNKSTMIYLNEKLNKIQSDFELDEIYHEFVIKGENLNESDKILFIIKYLEYLKRLFEILYEIEMELQTTINISPKEITKSIIYVEYKQFFRNNTEYATDTAQFISLMYYPEILDGYKKILGYYYTYKFLCFAKTKTKLDYAMNLIHSVLLDPDTIEKLKKISNVGKDNISLEYKSMLNKEMRIFSNNLFGKVYQDINGDLRKRNILPKERNKVMIDTSLI